MTEPAIEGAESIKNHGWRVTFAALVTLLVKPPHHQEQIEEEVEPAAVSEAESA